MANKQFSLNRIVLVLIIIFVSLGVSANFSGFAQAESDDWMSPVNLSLSGSTTAPVAVLDSDGVNHVVWVDIFKGSVYSEFIDEQWSTPTAFEFPFSGSVPKLIADSVGKIHAFWVGIDNFEGQLLYSNVLANDFATDNWSAPQQLSDSALTYEILVDSDNRLHVSYLRSVDSEDNDDLVAGIYYLQNNPSNGLWSDSVPLFQSPYFRDVIFENAQVRITIQEGEDSENVIFIGWENRPREKIQMIRSGDNGQTWGEPFDIASPETNNGLTIPIEPNLTMASNKLLVVWKNSFSASRCQQVYQIYTLEGQPESEVTPMLEELLGCPEDNFLMQVSDNETLLFTKIFGKIYFLIWDGEKWSLPQVQLGLSELMDPETLQTLEIGCYQLQYQDGVLFIIGCDNGDGEDIWVTTKVLDINESWFAKPSGWIDLMNVEISSGNIDPISIVTDQKGDFHILWAQSSQENIESYSIFYARWTGDTWAYIKSIIDPPMGKINGFSVAIDSDSKLHMVWSGGEGGEIYYSWANSDGAWNSKEWTKPMVLPMPQYIGSSVGIYIDKNDVIYVVYSIPINEFRGVYLTKSNDGGASWNDPVLLLDAIKEEWEVISDVDISGYSGTKLFVMAKRETFFLGEEQGALYVLYSSDGGGAWSSPELLSDLNPAWGYILPYREKDVYRVWQEGDEKNTVIWLDHSSDGGTTWSEPFNFAEPGARPGLADFVIDDLGYIHLVQLSQMKEDIFLREWIWDGSKWLAGQEQVLSSNNSTVRMDPIAISLNVKGFLGILTTRPQDDDAIENGMELVFTGRQLDLNGSEVEPPVSPLDTSEAVSTPESTETPTVEEDSTPTPQDNQTGNSSQNTPTFSINGISSEILGPMIGFIAAGLLVLLSFAVLYGISQRNQ